MFSVYLQYLRKVLNERKDLGDKIKIDGAEIDLAEGVDEVGKGMDQSPLVQNTRLYLDFNSALKIFCFLVQSNMHLT